MSAISPEELANLRTDFADMFFVGKDLVTFYRKAVPVLSDYGEESTGPDVVVSEDVPCRVGASQQRAAESGSTGQTRSKVPVDIFIPHDAERPSEADYAIITTQGNRRVEISGSEIVTDMYSIKVMGWEDN